MAHAKPPAILRLNSYPQHFDATTRDGVLQVYLCSDDSYFIHTRNDDPRLSGVSVSASDLDALIAALYRLRANAR